MVDHDIRDLPGIRVTEDDRVTTQPSGVRALREPPPRRQRNGALWAVCLTLLIALVGLGYWSHQQQTRLQRQLVATQESFARISEEAAGRLQDISGKVIATESTLSQGERDRIAQLRKLEQQVEQLAAALQTQQAQQQGLEQQQQALQSGLRGLAPVQQASEAQAQQLAALDKLVRTLGEQGEAQQQALAELREQAQLASESQAALRTELTAADQRLEALARLEQQLAAQDTQLARQRGELEALLEAAPGASVEQEMLVLRTELDQRLMSVEDTLKAVDSFRVQTNRNISTLRNQIANLQQQIDQR